MGYYSMFDGGDEGGRYWYAEWSRAGVTARAQTDKGRSHLKEYTGVRLGSGKILFKLHEISESEFYSNLHSDRIETV